MLILYFKGKIDKVASNKETLICRWCRTHGYTGGGTHTARAAHAVTLTDAVVVTLPVGTAILRTCTHVTPHTLALD